MKHYDESKVLRSIAKVAKIDYNRHRIIISKGSIIGIKRWGMIDFLKNYCGYVIVFINISVVDVKHNNENYNENKKEVKSKNKTKIKRSPKINKDDKPNKTLKTKRNERTKTKF